MHTLMAIKTFSKSNMDITQLLQNRPAFETVGKTKLRGLLRGQGIESKEVDDFLEKSALHAAYKKPSKGKPFTIVAPPRSFQIDIVLLPLYKGANLGKDKFLLLVDVLSRRAFAYVLKSGQMRDVLDAYGLFLDDVSDVHSVTGDNFFMRVSELHPHQHMGTPSFVANARRCCGIKMKG